MNVDFFSSFTYAWAQAGTYDVLDDSQYKLGWSFIGAVPPTVEQFNAVQQLTDKKLAWLYGQLKTAADAKGIALSSGDVGSLLELLDAVTPGASTTIAGLVKLATATQAQAQTDDTTALTPKKLSDALKGGNQALSSSGYQKLPGGLILQWGTSSTSASGFTTWTFPIAFPNAFFHAIGIGRQTDGSTISVNVNYADSNNSGAKVASSTDNAFTNVNVSMLAIGW